MDGLKYMIGKLDTFSDELHRLSESMAELKPDTALYRYIKWLNEQFECVDEKFKREYLPIIQKEDKNISEKRPFITIITRTQGRRIEMLRETLLSIAGQSDDDFEVIIIAHKANPENKAKIRTVIDEQPELFKNKIRYLEVDYGTRTTPMNIAFAHAHGEYGVFLDDDDIVFDNWVEGFHDMAKEKPGTILHAYVLTQNWMTIKLVDGTEAMRAVSAYGTSCCKDFNLIRQLDSNMCPLNGLAFPLYYFRELGMIFDETLTTTEDWDYFMRVSFISGVSDIKVPTCIYRLWVNFENSQTIHSQDEWDSNYKKIQDKYLNMPILLPQGSDKIFKIWISNDTEELKDRINTKKKIRKYIPNCIWQIMRKIYHLLGGKKWVG